MGRISSYSSPFTHAFCVTQKSNIASRKHRINHIDLNINMPTSVQVQQAADTVPQHLSSRIHEDVALNIRNPGQFTLVRIGYWVSCSDIY